MATAITAYRIPLNPVISFMYLGIFLLESGDKCTVLVQNLWKEQKKWAWLFRVLSREGADSWTLRRIYVAVVKAVLLFGLETWVMKPCIGRVLGRFHHIVARRLTG